MSKFPEKQWLENRYHKERMSLSAIADIAGVSISTVHYHMEKNGLERREKWERSTPPENRFWNRVDETTPDECWEWLGYTRPDGYGEVHFEGRLRRTHRVALRLEWGSYPEEMVLHSCDNRSCVNPNHLRVGNHEANMKDARLRGGFSER